MSAGLSGPVRNRFLILARVGDNALHGSWLDAAGGRRNWDLHLSYFGSKAAPALTNAPNTIWSREDVRSKWNGVYEAVQKAPYALDDYDYIALPDDDIVVEAQTWSRAFETAQAHNLAAAQLSLLHGSFFGWFFTIKLSGLELHYVTRLELMPPVIRMDVFKRLLPYMGMSNNKNVWAMDHVLGHIARESGEQLAVLDTASALHTRRFYTSDTYAIYEGGPGPKEVEDAFLRENNIPFIVEKITGALTLDGKRLRGVGLLRKLACIPARALRKWREINLIRRIAVMDDGELCLLRRFRGVTLGTVAPERIPEADRGRLLPAPVNAARKPGESAKRHCSPVSF